MEITRKYAKSTSSIVKDALASYFYPVSLLLSYFDKRFSIERKNELLQTKYTVKDVAFRIVQRAICLNQGRFLQYYFLTSEKHRNLKDAYRNNPNDLRSLADLKKTLTNFVNRGFYENTYENFKLLHAYFIGRANEQPRICIKGNFRAHDKDTIVTVFRDAKVEYDSDSDVDSNYGLYTVYKTGTYYLENNIPRALAEGRYYNQRLRMDKIKEYVSNRTQKRMLAWRNYWLGPKDDDKSSFYKSTLIVPMTLWNNDLTEEFKKLINLQNVDRTIFGFLCLDHTETEFFDEENDVLVGYAFSDLISLYLFIRLVYVEISKTFADVEGRLVKANKTIETEKLENIWKSVPRVRDVNDYLTFEPKKTDRNSLFPLDEDLMKYINAQ